MKYAVICGVILAMVVLAIAQSQFSAGTAVGPLTSCQAPATGNNILCSGPDGWYVSNNGAAYVGPLKPGSAGGVVTFNGRSGNVVPASGDYTFAQLTSPPTTITCATAQISTGASGSFTGSGCTIK